jgi:hypothetical protein
MLNFKLSPWFIVLKLTSFWVITQKDIILNIKFHQNPSSGSWVVPSGRTDMTKLTVAFRNSANTPKISKLLDNKTECSFYHLPAVIGGVTGE